MNLSQGSREIPARHEEFKMRLVVFVSGSLDGIVDTVCMYICIVHYYRKEKLVSGLFHNSQPY